MDLNKTYQILAVDDQRTILSHIKLVFKSVGDNYQVSTALDGQTAYQHALEHKPDLILMDLEMPGLSGLETLENLKKNYQTSQIPVIILSGERNFSEAFRAGAVDYITKPLDEVELAVRVKSTLTLVETFKELNEQKEMILQQRDAIENQMDVMRKQNELLEETQKDQQASIRYAQKLQLSLLDNEKEMKQHFEDYFLLSKPKDIVSGDFTWFAENDGKIYIAAADCTGHGVPGAFMSLVGYNGLNQATSDYQLSKPSDMLDVLNKNIFELFNKGHDNERDFVRDGMDIALCAIEKDTMKMEYAGAGNPLYIARNGELIELKPNRFSIGSYRGLKSNRFRNNEYMLEPGDTIYLFTDGYADQFGGPENKKFKYKPFKEFLLEVSSLKMSTQKKRLNEKLKEWKGNGEQIDDILVIGLRL